MGDKRVKEVEFALEDERKASEKAHDGLEKMHSKMKNMRLGLEDAEAQEAALQTKYKKATLQLEEAEERCETAERALQKARQRAKSQAQSLATTRGPSVGASRQRSRMRTPAAQD